VTSGRVTCTRGTDYRRAYKNLFGKPEIWETAAYVVYGKIIYWNWL